MNKRFKDFIGLFFFIFTFFTLGLIVMQSLFNFFKYMIYGESSSLDSNLRFFFSFEILIIILGTILGLIYIYWFKKYKTNSSEKIKTK